MVYYCYYTILYFTLSCVGIQLNVVLGGIELKYSGQVPQHSSTALVTIKAVK